MTKAELEQMTKDELVAYADEHEVEVQHSWLKDDIIKEILKAEKTTTSKPDSVKHLEERKSKIQAENQQNATVAQEDADNQEIANFHGLPKEGETRDQLLNRIRKMRDKPAEAEVEPVPRSAGLQKEFEAEQEAGKAAVAKVKEEMDRTTAALAKSEPAGEKKAG